MKRARRAALLSLALALVALAALLHGPELSTAETIPYSRFLALLEAGEVREVVIRGDALYVELTPEGAGARSVVTHLVAPDLVAALSAAGVAFSQEEEPSLLAPLLSWLVPTLLLIGIYSVLFRRVLGGGGAGLVAAGQSRARVYVETDTGVAFEDVAGVDEARAELEEVVAFLQNPAAYGRLGARMPRGVLLVGPPGTGKTLLARAVAGEAKVPFFSISGSEFVELFVGVGAARVRDLFAQARQRAPCILFIDELDALGRSRGIGSVTSGNDEKEQTLNQLLVEMDGFDSSTGIVLLAATNRPEILDPALLRAGRFDRRVAVDLPDRRGRTAILAVHLRKIRAAPEVSPGEIAGWTPGSSGADLATLVNEAALAATRRGAAAVEMADFTVALERQVAGLEKRGRVLRPREREIVAHHELGHALVARALPDADPVLKVSIIPRSVGALGYTIQRPVADRYLMTGPELEHKMAALLGGRAAEELIFGQVSTGAADDLARVADIARGMAARYGMVPELGHLAWEREPRGYLGLPAAGDHSEATERRIDEAVQALVARCYQRATAILAQNREILVEGARRLLAEETLTAEDLAPLFAGIRAGGGGEPGSCPPAAA